MRDSFLALAADTGVADTASLADALLVLYDGALATAEVDSTARTAAMTAKRIARLTIAVAKASTDEENTVDVSGERLAVVEVIEVTQQKSEAKLDEPVKKGMIEPGCKAVLLSVPPKLQFRIGFEHLAAGPRFRRRAAP